MNDMIAQSLGADQPLAPIERPLVKDVERGADFDQTRANLREMIEQSMEALPDMFNTLSQMQDPKMYMAAATFIKAIQDLNTDLVKIHKDKSSSNDAQAQPSIGQQTNNVTHNVVFHGSTEDYLRQKRAKEVIDAEVVEVTEVPIIEEK